MYAHLRKCCYLATLLRPALLVALGPVATPVIAHAQIFVTTLGPVNSSGDTQHDGGAIYEYTTSGAPVGAPLVPQLDNPSGIALIGTDRLYVASVNTGVSEYTASGATINAPLISGLSVSTDAAVSGGNIFVTSWGTGQVSQLSGSGMVGEYTSSGATVHASLISGLTRPESIVVSGDSLFVADTNPDTNYGRIGEYTASGQAVHGSLITGLVTPYGMAVSGDKLFITDFNDGTIGEYTTSGATVNATLISGLHNPLGVAVFGGDLFVVNRGTFTASGLVPNSGSIGEYDGITGGAINPSLMSGLNLPTGIAIVPEPSTLTLAGLGLMALACRLRRRLAISRRTWRLTDSGSGAPGGDDPLAARQAGVRV